jgi:hypothetical protein
LAFDFSRPLEIKNKTKNQSSKTNYLLGAGDAAVAGAEAAGDGC